MNFEGIHNIFFFEIFFLEEPINYFVIFQYMCACISGSLLSFQQNKMVPNNCYMKENGQKEVCVWENNLHQGRDHWNQTSPRNTRDMRLVENANCFQTSSGYISIVNNAKEKQHGQSSSGLLYPAPTIPNASSLHKLGAQESVLQKRPFMVFLSYMHQKKPCSRLVLRNLSEV